MAEPPNAIADLVGQVRERLAQELRANAERLEALERNLQELRQCQRQLEEAIQQQLETLAKFEPPAAAAPAVQEAPLENVLAAVRNLITATLPEQVLEVLTEEAVQLGVRAAVFDVRGRAAWGSAAGGFGVPLPDKVLRTLVVPLNQDNPFRQVYETAGHVDASVDSLKRNRNILDKFKPHPGDQILLLPIRSAGAVSAIFYADAGGKAVALPVDALKILAEFAGAQLDRLMALSGGVPSLPDEVEAEATVEAEPLAGPETAEPAEAVVETSEAEPAEQAVAVESTAAVARVQAAATSVVESVPVIEAPPPPPAIEPPAAPPPAAPALAAGFDIAQLSEADQKVHKDARRFAKLLVSEIDLYNKPKVSDGRKNKDIYQRLKADIDRSRLTYEKRFGKTLAKQSDYFHEEVVKILAGNDPSALGPDYPGPSV